MKAVVFDLGDTLIEYEGIPLNWVSLYPAALKALAGEWQLEPTAEMIKAACDVLTGFNTRIHPRTEEVSFLKILTAIARCLEHSGDLDERRNSETFFHVFRQHLHCFSDAKNALDLLRQDGLTSAIFTDVPYGMPRELVLADLCAAGLSNAVDHVVTSRDIGFRKPAIETLQFVARQINCSADQMIYVGNERKDIDVACAWGCRSVLIDRGQKGEQWGQTYTIKSLDELPAIYRRI